VPTRPLYFLERLQIAFTALLLLLQFAAWNRLPHPGLMAGLYALLIALVFLLARYTGPAAQWLRHLTPIFYLLAIYESLGQTTPYLVSRWLEPHLVAWDASWFASSTAAAASLATHPFLIDLLFLAYVSYYLLPIALLAILFLKKHAGFREAVNTIAITFYVHYLMYLVFPVVGPHRNPDLAGAASIPIGGLLAELCKTFVGHAELTAEDCFPSAHTSIAILCVLLAWRHQRSLVAWLAPPALLITLATVVLRFHYVADVLAGLVLAAAAYAWAPALPERAPQLAFRAIQPAMEAAGEADS